MMDWLKSKMKKRKGAGEAEAESEGYYIDSTVSSKQREREYRQRQAEQVEQEEPVVEPSTPAPTPMKPDRLRRPTGEQQREAYRSRYEKELEQLGFPATTPSKERVYIPPTGAIRDAKTGEILIPGEPGHHEISDVEPLEIPLHERLAALSKFKQQQAQAAAATRKSEVELKKAQYAAFKLSPAGMALGAGQAMAKGTARAVGSLGAGAGKAMGTGAGAMRVGTSWHTPTKAPSPGSMHTAASMALIPSSKSAAAKALAPAMSPAALMLKPRMTTTVGMPATVLPGLRIPLLAGAAQLPQLRIPLFGNVGTPSVLPARAIRPYPVVRSYPQVSTARLTGQQVLLQRRVAAPQSRSTVLVRTKKGQGKNRYKAEVARIKRMRPAI